jgi:outer membrane autotransporter protein
LVPYAEVGVQETFTGLSRDVTMTDGTLTGSAAGISPAPTAGVVGVGVSAGMTEALDLSGTVFCQPGGKHLRRWPGIAVLTAVAMPLRPEGRR